MAIKWHSKLRKCQTMNFFAATERKFLAANCTLSTIKWPCH